MAIDGMAARLYYWHIDTPMIYADAWATRADAFRHYDGKYSLLNIDAAIAHTYMSDAVFML